MKKAVFASSLLVLTVILLSGCSSTGVETSTTNPGGGDAAAGSQTAVETKETYKIGEPISLGDMVVTINSIEFSQGGQFSKPSEGNQWANVNMTIENGSSKQEFVTTMGQMNLVDAGGNQYSVAVTDKVMENPNNSLDGAIIAKAKKTGWVGFEVPENAQGLVFRYNASMWSDKAAEISLQ